MISERFWALIDATRPAEPDPDLHADALTRALVDRGIAATITFDGEFRAAMAALDRWDLWGAGYLLLGGLSDRGFERFRAWVVGEGRATWGQQLVDPEGYLVNLVDQIVADGDDLFEALDRRALAEGESLLRAAGVAHEQLTGATIRDDPDQHGREATEPAGEPWKEGDVASAFPRLAGALEQARVAGGIAEFSTSSGPASIGTVNRSAGYATEVIARLERAASAADDASHRYAQRDLAGVLEILSPVLDDSLVRRSFIRALPPDAASVVLYQGAISRFGLGDPDGAAEWLEFAVARGAIDGSIRRALAQVLMSMGELDRAERRLGLGPLADPMDLAIATAIAGYRRDHAEVLRRRTATFAAIERPYFRVHPRDLAAMHVVMGQALVEVGEWSPALASATAVRVLVHGEPSEFRVAAQGEMLAAGALRIAGHLATAEATLEAVWPLLQPGTCDLGTAEREAARLHQAAGRLDQASNLYARAVATFRASGEHFLAIDAEQEAASTGR